MPVTSFNAVVNSLTNCQPLNVKFVNTTSTVDTIPNTQYFWDFGNAGAAVTGYDSILYRTFYNASDSIAKVYQIKLLAMATVAPNVICIDSTFRTVTVLQE
jgi:hypothetical protein